MVKEREREMSFWVALVRRVITFFPIICILMSEKREKMELYLDGTGDELRENRGWSRRKRCRRSKFLAIGKALVGVVLVYHRIFLLQLLPTLALPLLLHLLTSVLELGPDLRCLVTLSPTSVTSAPRVLELDCLSSADGVHFSV